jgi:hypothetical protein
MLAESGRGTHSHSTCPLGATRAFVSQSERKAYDPTSGNALTRAFYPDDHLGSGCGDPPGNSSTVLMSSGLRV